MSNRIGRKRSNLARDFWSSRGVTFEPPSKMVSSIPDTSMIVVVIGVVMIALTIIAYVVTRILA